MTQWLAEAPIAGLTALALFLMERATLLEHQDQKERDGFSCCLAELFIWTSGSSLLRNTSVGKSGIRTQQGIIYHFRDKPRSRLRFGARRQGQSWPMTSHWDEYNQGSASSFPCKRPLKLPLKRPVILSLSRLPKGNKNHSVKRWLGSGRPLALHDPTSDNPTRPSVDNPNLLVTSLSPKPCCSKQIKNALPSTLSIICIYTKYNLGGKKSERIFVNTLLKFLSINNSFNSQFALIFL